MVEVYIYISCSRTPPHPPQWTWECVNQRCERQEIRAAAAAVSLATCSMLCGSTQLWPQPTGPVTLGSRAAAFNHRQLVLETTARPPARALLDKAFGSFNDNVVAMVKTPGYVKDATDIRRFVVRVSIARPEVVRLKLSTDESYSIVLKPLGDEMVANVTAQTFFGARHGLETLSQLIW